MYSNGVVDSLLAKFSKSSNSTSADRTLIPPATLPKVSPTVHPTAPPIPLQSNPTLSRSRFKPIAKTSSNTIEQQPNKSQSTPVAQPLPPTLHNQNQLKPAQHSKRFVPISRKAAPQSPEKNIAQNPCTPIAPPLTSTHQLSPPKSNQQSAAETASQLKIHEQSNSFTAKSTSNLVNPNIYENNGKPPDVSNTALDTSFNQTPDPPDTSTDDVVLRITFEEESEHSYHGPSVLLAKPVARKHTVKPLQTPLFPAFLDFDSLSPSPPSTPRPPIHPPSTLNNNEKLMQLLSDVSAWNNKLATSQHSDTPDTPKPPDTEEENIQHTNIKPSGDVNENEDKSEKENKSEKIEASLPPKTTTTKRAKNGLVIEYFSQMPSLSAPTPQYAPNDWDLLRSGNILPDIVSLEDFAKLPKRASKKPKI